MRRVVINHKGGVGKSTIACNLAAIAATRGQKTLVVDLDPQSNSSQYLLSSSDVEVSATVGDFFSACLTPKAKPQLADYITATPFENLHVVVADPEMLDLEDKLTSRHKIYKLGEALRKLDYDQVFIDTPPALNFFAKTALISAERCLVPFDCDDFARQGLYSLFDIVAEIQDDHNDELEIEGIVVNQYNSRARLPNELLDQLAEEELPILNAKLSSSVVVKESHQLSKPLIHSHPKHKLTMEFIALHDELDAK